jgi:hypothetical protein
MSERLALTSDALTQLRRHVADGLAKIDPHHRLLGRPICYRIIDGQAIEVTFRDVPGIAEGELLGLKRLIGTECFCTVSPQTAESVMVRLVVPRRPDPRTPGRPPAS